MVIGRLAASARLALNTRARPWAPDTRRDNVPRRAKDARPPRNVARPVGPLYVSPARQCWVKRFMRGESRQGRHTMPHSYGNNHLHVIFSTRERRPTIPASTLAELWAVIAGIGRNHRLAMIKVGLAAGAGIFHLTSHVIRDIVCRVSISN